MALADTLHPIRAKHGYALAEADRGHDLSWQDMAGRWIAAQRSSNTRAAYGRDLADFAAWITDAGAESPLTADRAVVDTYTRHLEAEGKKPATVARRLAALSSFFDYAVGEKWLTENPVARVRRPKLPEVSPRQWLTKDQARDCLEAATGMSSSHQALFALCFLAGLRVSEALAVRVEDLGEAQGHRVVRVTRKGGKVEEVVTNAPCLRLLASAVGNRTEGRLIEGPRGGVIDRHRAARMVAEVGRAAGLKRPLVPHDLRHSCGVLSLAAGAPLHRVQQQLGHADPRTTQRYTHHLERLDNAAAYDLAGFLS